MLTHPDPKTVIMHDARFQTFSEPTLLDQGDTAYIFHIAPEYVVKVLKSQHVAQEKIMLSHEFDMMKRVKYRCNIPMPRAEGIFALNVIEVTPVDTCEDIGLVMEYIPGIRGDRTSDDRKMKRKLKKLLWRSRQKGFDPQDHGLHNTIYHPDNDLLYIIDVAMWEQKERME